MRSALQLDKRKDELQDKRTSSRANYQRRMNAYHPPYFTKRLNRWGEEMDESS